MADAGRLGDITVGSRVRYTGARVTVPASGGTAPAGRAVLEAGMVGQVTAAAEGRVVVAFDAGWRADFPAGAEGFEATGQPGDVAGTRAD
jgi:hypothetical protein